MLRLSPGLALALVLVGCGSDGGSDAGDDAGDDGEAAAVVAAATSDLGEILVDGDGVTLYVFDQDADGESSCYDDCATTWPPLLGPAEAGDGADTELIGSTERTDGGEQVTYGGQPLYYFASDADAGDVNGQGVGDVWWVISPDGERMADAAAASDRDY